MSPIKQTKSTKHSKPLEFITPKVRFLTRGKYSVRNDTTPCQPALSRMLTKPGFQPITYVTLVVHNSDLHRKADFMPVLWKREWTYNDLFEVILNKIGLSREHKFPLYFVTRCQTTDDTFHYFTSNYLLCSRSSVHIPPCPCVEGPNGENIYKHSDMKNVVLAEFMTDVVQIEMVLSHHMERWRTQVPSHNFSSESLTCVLTYEDAK